MKRFFGKQYTTRPSQENEDTNDSLRPSTSRRRSTQPQTEYEIPTSSDQYKKIHDDKMHILDRADGLNTLSLGSI